MHVSLISFLVSCNPLFVVHPLPLLLLILLLCKCTAWAFLLHCLLLHRHACPESLVVLDGLKQLLGSNVLLKPIKGGKVDPNIRLVHCCSGKPKLLFKLSRYPLCVVVVSWLERLRGQSRCDLRSSGCSSRMPLSCIFGRRLKKGICVD
jgi:hypothetical protein